MLRGSFSGLRSLGNTKNVVSTILVANAFVWYYAVVSSLASIEPPIPLWIWFLHFFAMIVSALAGASFGKRFDRSNFLIVWLITGTVSSAMFFALGSPSLVLVGLVSLFLGISLGFGMPACMSYFSDSVVVESRGRVSGITMLGSGIGIVAFGSLLGPGTPDLSLIGMVLAVWRLIGLLVFLWAKDYRRIERKEVTLSYRQILGQQHFVLYFAPWVMFSLVNYIASPMVPDSTRADYALLPIVQLAFMGASAIFGGFFVDSIGRKRIAIAGFAMLGLGSAVIGFSGTSLASIPYAVLCFNAVLDGVAWGFLLVLFILTLWGDLSHSYSSDKYYALGVLPFFASMFLEQLVGELIPPRITSSTALVSFVSFFLFLAVLPLVYAPETLPEKVMKKRELTIYVEKAQEIAEKYY
jgi:MFS family permease